MAAGDDFAWIGAAASDTVRVATDAGEIATDGRFGFARISDGVVTAFNVQDGSFLSLAGVQVFSAAAAIDVSLAFADSGLSGFLRGSQDGYQVVVQTADSVAAVTYQDAAAASVYGDGAVTLQLFGEGQLAADTIPIALIPANVPPAAAGQSVSTDEDTPISLTLTGTDADGDELTFAIAVSPPTVTLPTDYDGNGRVDLFDFFLFADAFGEPVDEDSTRFDLDGNGRVDLFDFFIFADSFGATVHFLDGTDG